MANFFQDAEGDFSSKRLVLVSLVGLFSFLTILDVFGLHVAQYIYDNVTQLITWIGGFVTAERARDFSPWKQKADSDSILPQLGTPEPYE